MSRYRLRAKRALISFHQGNRASPFPTISGVCCSVMQCAAVCCSVLQCDAVCCSVAKRVDLMVATDEQSESSSDDLRGVLHCVALCCSVLQCVALCCNVRGSPFGIKGTGRVPLRRSQVCVAVRSQCVAVVCSVLQCVATRVDLLSAIHQMNRASPAPTISGRHSQNIFLLQNCLI